jgi:hypothetical protein
MIRLVVICVMYPGLARYWGRFVLKFDIVSRTSIQASAGRVDWFRLENLPSKVRLDGVKARSSGRTYRLTYH